jgi:hypothetical protein
MDKEVAGRHIRTFEQGLENVPEVEEAIRAAGEEVSETARVFDDYLDLARRLAKLSPEQTRLVAEANEELNRRGGRSGSAVKEGADIFLEELGETGRQRLLEVISQAADPDSPNYQETVAELAAMMEGGHQLKVSGKRPVDGDPLSDKVIWGHTQISDPVALRHFVICHYLERYVSVSLRKLGVRAAKRKDFFLNAMTDVIILEEMSNSGEPSIFTMWSTPKDQGGLGWIPQERIDSYKTVLGKSGRETRDGF